MEGQAACGALYSSRCTIFLPCFARVTCLSLWAPLVAVHCNALGKAYPDHCILAAMLLNLFPFASLPCANCCKLA